MRAGPPERQRISAEDACSSAPASGGRSDGRVTRSTRRLLRTAPPSQFRGAFYSINYFSLKGYPYSLPTKLTCRASSGYRNCAGASNCCDKLVEQRLNGYAPRRGSELGSHRSPSVCVLVVSPPAPWTGHG